MKDILTHDSNLVIFDPDNKAVTVKIERNLLYVMIVNKLLSVVI